MTHVYTLFYTTLFRSVGGSHGKGQQTNHGNAHANRERVRLRPAVGVEPHDRLKQRSGQLQREGDPPNLSVIEMERSEEHTSEILSLTHLVCRLRLTKS